MKAYSIPLLLVFLFSTELTGFGGFSISQRLFSFILYTLNGHPTSKSKSANKKPILLELGSGWGTGVLSNFSEIYSVEHDPRWVGQYRSHYIHAPIVDGWYDVEVLKKELPKEYDLILVDGPPGYIGRDGFLKNIHLFRMDVPIIIDDVHRQAELDLLIKTAEKLNREYKIYNDENGESRFGVIFP